MLTEALPQVLWLASGIVLLLFAGDALVRGAVALSLKAGVSPLVAGVVVVGFGTSLPEMLVSVEAALTNAEDLAHGNIVGSNIANFGLVLAVPALISGVSQAEYHRCQRGAPLGIEPPIFRLGNVVNQF